MVTTSVVQMTKTVPFNYKRHRQLCDHGKSHPALIIAAYRNRLSVNPTRHELLLRTPSRVFRSLSPYRILHPNLNYLRQRPSRTQKTMGSLWKAVGVTKPCVSKRASFRERSLSPLLLQFRSTFKIQRHGCLGMITTLRTLHII